MASENKSESGYCTLTVSRWELASVRAAHPEFEDSPLAIVSSGRILEASPYAEKVGITAGMSCREAHSRLPSLVLVEADEELSGRAFAPILKAVFEVTPFVQIERAGHIHFPLEGLLSYYKSAESLADRILASLPSSSVLVPRADTTPVVGLGIAPTRIASLLAASKAAKLGELASENPPAFGTSYIKTPSPVIGSARDSVFRPFRASDRRLPQVFRSASGHDSSTRAAVSVGVSPGEGVCASACWVLVELEASPASFVGEFPLEALEYVLEPQDPHDIEVLHLLGIHTLAELASLDPNLLADRFGKWAIRAWTLANGLDPDVLLPVFPPTDSAVECDFDPPVSTMDRLLFAAGELVARLAERLKAEAKECRYLRLELVEESGRSAAVAWRVQGPLSRAAYRCRWHLESIAVSSPVIKLRLIPEDLLPLQGTQLCIDGLSSSLSFEKANDNHWETIDKTLDRVDSILGEHASYFIQIDDSGPFRGHLPHEDAAFVNRSLMQSFWADLSESERSSKSKGATKRSLSRSVHIPPRSLPPDSPFRSASLSLGSSCRDLPHGSLRSSNEAHSPALLGALPLPYPSLISRVEVIRDAYDSQPSFGAKPQTQRRSLSLKHRLRTSRSLELFRYPSALVAIEFHKEPIVVRKGPRVTDPPSVVESQPVVSAAGPWSYLLEWWDEQRCFSGEIWQVVVESPDGLLGQLIFRADDGLWYLYGLYD